MNKLNDHHQRHHPATRGEGFTLMEIVIVMAMLVIVLVTTYSIFIESIETERDVEEITMPEKVGEGILTLMRRDIAGAVFKGCTEALKNNVFIGDDDGDQDRISFVTTVDPTPREDQQFNVEDFRALTMISYRLEGNDNAAYTLYRKEIVEFGQGDIDNFPGTSYSVYDKVKSLNIDYFNGLDWVVEWDSAFAIEEQLTWQQEEEGRLGSTNSNIPRVSGQPSAEDEEGLLEEGEQQAAPIPLAVRIQLVLFSGSGDKLVEEDGQPKEWTFTTIVPLLASRRLSIPIEDEMLAADGGAGGSRSGGGGEDGAVSTFGADLTKKGRGEGGKGSLRDKLTERPGRSSGRGQGGRGGRNPAPGIRDKAVNALKNRLPSGGGTRSFGGGGKGGGRGG